MFCSLFREVPVTLVEAILLLAEISLHRKDFVLPELSSHSRFFPVQPLQHIFCLPPFQSPLKELLCASLHRKALFRPNR